MDGCRTHFGFSRAGIESEKCAAIRPKSWQKQSPCPLDGQVSLSPCGAQVRIAEGEANASLSSSVETGENKSRNRKDEMRNDEVRIRQNEKSSGQIENRGEEN